MTAEQRDAEICRLYVEGKTLHECGERFKITRERVRQILRKAGIYKNFRAKPQAVGLKDGVVESSARDVFLGVNVSEADKAALRELAAKRGISMSALTADLIREMLASLGKEA